MTRTRSSKSYDERLQDINPVNRYYVEQFLVSEHGDEKSYRSQVFRFVEYLKDTSIAQISPREIKDYLLQPSNTPKHVVGMARILTFFLGLLPAQESNIAILREIASEKEKESKNKEPISLDDVINFRKKLVDSHNDKALFLFDMLYVHGLKWIDFENITPNSYSQKIGELSTRSKGTILLSQNLQRILDHDLEILAPKSYGALAGYLRDASEMFGKSITETVIEETRKRYFPTCQICNNQYPNTSEYWALVECKDDPYLEKWLLCIFCAKRVDKQA